ncbi:hypothetical protein Vi05172_g10798 [Venturia inaequalis]|nr:hypothetical protein Vi05172_g10798 [Venturia inaequalis]
MHCLQIISLVLLPAALALPIAQQASSVIVSNSAESSFSLASVGSRVVRRLPIYNLARSENHDVEYRRY